MGVGELPCPNYVTEECKVEGCFGLIRNKLQNVPARSSIPKSDVISFASKLPHQGSI